MTKKFWLGFGFNYTPKHWEIGIGFYCGNKEYDLSPELAIMIGPVSFTIFFGQ